MEVLHIRSVFASFHLLSSHVETVFYYNGIYVRSVMLFFLRFGMTKMSTLVLQKADTSVQRQINLYYALAI